MKIRIIILVIIISLFSVKDIFAVSDVNHALSNIYIEIKWKQYRGDLIYQAVDNKFYKINWWDTEKILLSYKNIIISLDTLLQKKSFTKDQVQKLKNINLIIEYWVIKYENILFNTVKKIKLWESESWQAIYWYYRWNPKNGFFWIFANLHGSYEYGTYQTANYLIRELEKTNTTGWFIIPTINPDGLSYYESEWNHHTFYLKWRGNINNIDLNRNFCTKNFELKTFNKYWSYFQTGINWCNSEKETKAIINVLDTYKFNEIISLHSVGWNFFIPDWSIDDIRITRLWKKMKEILRNYIFDISYSNTHEKEDKIFEYEIDEWWSKKFTWTMETYIYEKYNIPILIIELKQHWKIEYDLIKIISLLNDN